MKKVTKIFFLTLFSIFLFIGCSSKDNVEETDKPLQVISSFTILTDMLNQIGKDHIEVYNLVPTGTDPHEYEPLPEDIKKATDADVFFYNGLNLEGNEEGWFFKLIRSVGKTEDEVFNLNEGVEPQYLDDEKGNRETNPHSFISPKVGIQMAENARDVLIKIDPENENDYKENAEQYIAKLKDMDQKYEDKINEIPEENRILVTSERAFQYLANDYGLKEGFIWQVDTEENGTPEQIKSLLTFLQDHDVPALFLETNVDDRPMKTISKESNIEIYGEVYSDEIGQPGEEVDTYLKYLDFNIEQIYNGLKKH